jgi:glycerophosphoryl diester phosphodiesterase
MDDLLDICLILSRLWALGSAESLALAFLGIEHRALSIVPFFRAGRPRVFAHRGGCALGPENTIAAFDRGIASGADGLELDVRLSADGMVVVCHDETLDRTTDATGPVAARSAADLSRVDAGHHFTDGNGRHPFRGQGVGIPTLRAVLERYTDAAIIIEMKPDSEEMGRALVAEVRRADAIGRVCAAGYGSRSLATVREALPEIASSASRMEVRLALYRSWAAWPVSRPAYGVYQVPELAGTLRVVSPRFIRYAHHAGVEVQVWTVDRADDMRRLLGWGADALISNQPDLAVRVRDEFVSAGQSSTATRP